MLTGTLNSTIIRYFILNKEVSSKRFERKRLQQKEEIIVLEMTLFHFISKFFVIITLPFNPDDII